MATLDRRWVVVSLLALLIVVPRLFLGQCCAPHVSPDTGTYVDGARAIRQWVPHEHLLYRVPGYAAFLALCGFESPDMLERAVQVQQNLGIVLAVIIFDMARIVFSSTAHGLMAVALYGVNVRFLLYGQNVLTESVFTTLVCVVLWLVLRGVKANNPGWLFAAAGVLSQAVLVRPVALLFAFIPAACCLAVFVPGDSARRRCGRVAIFLAIAYFLPGVWIVRNGLTAGYWGLTPSGQIFLLEHTAELVDLSSDVERPTREVVVRIARDGRPRISVAMAIEEELSRRGMSCVDKGRALAPINREAIVRSPLRYLSGTVPQLWSLLFGGGPNDLIRWKSQYGGGVLIAPWPGTGLLKNTRGESLGARFRRLAQAVDDQEALSLLVNLLKSPLEGVVIVTLLLVAVARMVMDRRILQVGPLLLLLSTAYFWVFPCLTVLGLERYRLVGEPMATILIVWGLLGHRGMALPAVGQGEAPSPSSVRSPCSA